MITKKEYVRLTFENNLYYSRILMEHATMILTLIGDSLEEQKKIFIEEQDKYTTMSNLLLNFSNGKVSKEFIDSNKLVTPMTRKLEEDTMKLFDVKIDLSLTVKSLNLKSGDFQLNADLINEADNINKQMLTLIAKTIVRVKNIMDLHIIKNELLLNHFVKESFTFSKAIERTISCFGIDPTYVYSALYYYTDYMKEHSELYGELLSSNNELFKAQALDLYNQSSKLMKAFDNVISPTTIKNLSASSSIIATEFNKYNNKLNDALMIKTSVLSCAPILSDHILRENYYFLSVLALIVKN